MKDAYPVSEIDRRIRELGERERAKGAGYDNSVTVRFVEPTMPKRRRRRKSAHPWRQGRAA